MNENSISEEEAIKQVQIWANEGDFNKAAQGCREILEVDPSNEEVKKMLNEYEQKLNQQTPIVQEVPQPEAATPQSSQPAQAENGLNMFNPDNQQTNVENKEPSTPTSAINFEMPNGANQNNNEAANAEINSTPQITETISGINNTIPAAIPTIENLNTNPVNENINNQVSNIETTANFAVENQTPNMGFPEAGNEPDSENTGNFSLENNQNELSTPSGTEPTFSLEGHDNMNLDNLSESPDLNIPLPSEEKERKTGVKIMAVLVAIIIIGGSGYFAYSYFNANKKSNLTPPSADLFTNTSPTPTPISTPSPTPEFPLLPDSSIFETDTNSIGISPSPAIDGISTESTNSPLPDLQVNSPSPEPSNQIIEPSPEASSTPGKVKVDLGF